jgi:hypothetical protein
MIAKGVVRLMIHGFIGRHRIESGIPLGILASSHSEEEWPAYRFFRESPPRKEDESPKMHIMFKKSKQ